VNDKPHAGYYPGAQLLLLKLLWDPADGSLLGAQATGLAGVDKRLDVLATAIAGGLTIDDLAELELAYAPPFGSAKDIVNLAGMAACNAATASSSRSIRCPTIRRADRRRPPPALAQKHPVPRSA
jgi:hypothetical protein